MTKSRPESSRGANTDPCNSDDSSESSSYELVGSDDFSITYLSGESSLGDYITEDFHIGGTTIESLQMGLALSSQINSGIIGVGFGNAVPYPNIMDEFKAQGLIETMAYSLWLVSLTHNKDELIGSPSSIVLVFKKKLVGRGEALTDMPQNDISSDTGTILFGAIDSEKYIDSISAIPIVPASDDEFYHFQVAMSSLNVTSPSNAFETFGAFRGQLIAILDSGTTLSYLPSGIVNELFETIGAVDDTFRTGAVFISCSIFDRFPDLEFSFSFADANDDFAATISVPLREMVLDNVRPFLRQGFTLPPDIPFEDDDVCSLGLQAIDGGGAASRGGQVITDLALLGDTFLRSAYVVYDLDNREIGLAQANLNTTESNIVEITDGIPIDVSGVESQVPFTATGSVDITVTTDSTGLVTTITVGAGADDEDTENATIPRLDAKGLWMSGIVGAIVMLWMGVGAFMVVL